MIDSKLPVDSRLTRRTLGLALAAATLLASAQAAVDERVRVMVMDESVMVTTVIAGDALLAFDSDGDGQLSRMEFDAQFQPILDWAEARFVLQADDGQALIAVSRNLPALEYGSGERSSVVEYVRVLLRYHVPSPVQADSLSIHLLGSEGARREYVVWEAQPPRYGSFDERGGVIDLNAASAFYR